MQRLLFQATWLQKIETLAGFCAEAGRTKSELSLFEAFRLVAPHTDALAGDELDQGSSKSIQCSGVSAA